MTTNYIVGLLLSIIILLGGEPPNLFSPSIGKYMTSGLGKHNPAIEEIPNASVWTSLEKVCYSLVVFIFVHVVEVEHVRLELQKISEHKTKGAIIRSRTRWYEHGERNSKYLEKCAYKGKHIVTNSKQKKMDV